MCHGGADPADARDRSPGLECGAAQDQVHSASSSSLRAPSPSLAKCECGVPPQGGMLSDWMSDLVSDSVSLAEVSLPGTHNSSSWSPSAFVAASQCQAKDLISQLHMGVRFFDFRVRPSGGLCHGVVSCSLTLSEALDTCTAFLNNHRREVLVVRVKDEAQGGRGSSRKVDELMRSIAESACYPLFLQQRLPIMREVRGRIVLLADWAHASFGIPWGGSLFKIQDEYRCKTGEDKWQVVERTLQGARRGQGLLHINFTSATALPSRGPLAIARVVNPRLAAYLRARPCPGFLGTVVMDFPSTSLCELVVRRNRSPLALSFDRPVVDLAADRWLTTLRNEVRAVANRADEVAVRMEGTLQAGEKSRQHGPWKDAVRQVARVYARLLTEHATTEIQLPVTAEPAAQQASSNNHLKVESKPRLRWSGPTLPRDKASSPRRGSRASSCGVPVRDEVRSLTPQPTRPHSAQDLCPLPTDVRSAGPASSSPESSASKTRRVVVKRFTAAFQREDTLELGVQVAAHDSGRLLVLAVEELGAVAAYNKGHPDAAIIQGDYIAAVNDVAGDTEKMWKLLQDGRGAMQLDVMHPMGAADKDGAVTDPSTTGRMSHLQRIFGARSRQSV
mmetsp:Transcript_19983/g.46501  ORF Transcript_19983/g.46501 Transcript_19983/m.46501 type:complete len:618 (-) Transcript_19983:68-1921(-)